MSGESELAQLLQQGGLWHVQQRLLYSICVLPSRWSATRASEHCLHALGWLVGVPIRLWALRVGFQLMLIAISQLSVHAGHVGYLQSDRVRDAKFR